MANEHVFNNNIVVSGSVTSSVGFKGDGSGLTNITSTAEWDGSRTGDSSITGSLTVSGSSAVVNLLNAEGGVSGSFSGSYEGDGSNLTNLSIFPFTGTALITGSLTVSGSGIHAVDFQGIDNIRGGTFSGSFLGNGSALTNLNINGIQASGSTLTGSFQGDGSGLTGVSSEWDGSRNGDANITGSFIVSGSGVNIDLKGPTIIDSNIMVGNKDDLTAISIGQGALPSASVGLRESVAIGCNAGASLISGSNSVFIGNSAASASIKTVGDVAIGYEALKKSIGTDDGTSTNKTRNTAVGFRSLCANTTGQCNVAIGAQAGEDNTSGCHSIFIGNCAGGNSLSACYNVNIGNEARCVARVGNYNVSIGNCAALNSCGDFSTAVGYEALKGAALIPGDGNTAVGYRAGFNASGSSCKNVYLGVQAGPNGTTHEENQLYINNSPGTPLIKGDFLTCQVQFRGGVTGSSFTGSFVGDGSSLTGITADWDGSHIGKASITGSLILSGSDVKLDLLNAEAGASGSFSGSFQGDGSGLTGVSAEWDGSRNGDANITGSLVISGSAVSLNVLGDITGSSTITIGADHSNAGEVSSIAGGCCNCTTAASSCSFIGGGRCNSITGTQNIIGGGVTNCVQGAFGAILGGAQNDICCGNHSSIVGGKKNFICGASGHTVNCNFIGGGEENLIDSGSTYIVIGGGCKNTGSADYGAILSGKNNFLNHNCSFIIGDSLTSTKACYTFMNNLDVVGTISGSVISGSFVGDGSNLTGVISSATDSFKTITVAGQSDVVADSSTDTLTLAAGANVTLTTDASSDTITIASAGGGSGTGGSASPFYTGSAAQTGIVAGGTSPSGSNHCIAVPSLSTIAGGQSNTLLSVQGFIGAGSANYISGSSRSGIVAGQSNSASLQHNSFIGAGCSNKVESACSAIIAGLSNTITGTLNHANLIGAGRGNNISGSENFIAAGEYSTITGSRGAIVGGCDHIYRNGLNGVILGGNGNCILAGGSNSAIMGSSNNLISGSGTAVIIGSGTSGNKILTGSRSIAIGSSNCIYQEGVYAFGTSNKILSGSCRAMSIGFSNIVKHQCSIALGYSVNSDCENTVFVANLCATDLIRARKLNVGLTQTLVDSDRSSIVGGANNKMTGSNCSTLAGGRLNTISASNHQFIGAGCKNTGSAAHSFIGSGFKNFINHVGSCSGIVGGCCNTVEHANSFIVGSKLATDAACTTYVNNFHVKGPQIGDTTIIFESLPTLDPGLAGQLYNDNGTLKVSLG